MDYVFSRHSLEQMKHRNISKETVLNVLNNPDEIKIENGKKIYQAVIKTEGKTTWSEFLLIFKTDLTKL